MAMKKKMNKLLPKRSQDSNKGTFGTVLNVSGSEEYSGAAVLSSVASLKVGAGKVILCSTENTLAAASYRVPELVLISREGVSFDGVTSVVLGCGLSQDKGACQIFEKVISTVGDIPLVIDADGLNILAKGQYKLGRNTILTPHPKEMSRLLGIELDEVLNNREKALRSCVEKYGVTTVLKGHHTLIMDVEGNLYENTTGNSALAKAGSGDVLAGMIGGLLAQGVSCYDGACLGVYLHGLAGELASEVESEYSVLASDLLEYIGKAIKKGK